MDDLKLMQLIRAQHEYSSLLHEYWDRVICHLIGMDKVYDRGFCAVRMGPRLECGAFLTGVSQW